MKNNVKILKERTTFNKKLIIEEGKISINRKKFSRERVVREDAAAVLVYNSDSKKVILTKQFRFAVASRTKEEILEIVAGRIGNGKSPEEVAIKETMEEIGFRIKKRNLKPFVSCFSTPGYSTECFHIFYAKVTEDDRISDGGGNHDENEYIQKVEIGLEEFRSMIQNGGIKDAKTYIAALYLFSYGGTDY